MTLSRQRPSATSQVLVQHEDVTSAVVLPIGTVTLLLTDVEGSTDLWESGEAVAAMAIARHYPLLNAAIALHDGVRPVEQGEGDSVVAAFTKASDALAAALDVQRAFLEEPWPEAATVRVRIALHTGEIDLRDEGNYLGPTIIRCARLRTPPTAARPLLSSTTHDLVDRSSARRRRAARPRCAPVQGPRSCRARLAAVSPRARRWLPAAAFARCRSRTTCPCS